jgi:apolipoprotein N-acyltransferase
MNLRQIVERRYVGSVVAFVAGMLLSLSYAPYQWWPLAIAMPAVLIWLWEGGSPRRAAVLGFWFNAGTFGAGTYWLYIAIAQNGHAPVYIALFLMAGLVAIMGAYHALLGWLVARFAPERGALRWLVCIPAMWLLIEWFRSWFLSGFGWLALGYSQTDTWLSGLAPVVGQFGLGLLVLVMAGGVVTLVLGSQRERLLAVASIVVIWAAGFGLGKVEWTKPYAREISVSVVQGSVSADDKWVEKNLQGILDLYQNLTRQALDSDLIVWPEAAAPVLANNILPYYEDIMRDVSKHGAALVVGTLREDQGEYFNSVLSMDMRVGKSGWYDKHHLVPFVEFFPVPEFVRQWLRFMDLPYSDFTHGGAHQEPLVAAGQKIAATVCFDDAYGSTQLPALRTATLLVNVTNDAWFGRSTARYQHLQISRMRAMEAGRPIVRAANDGVSAVINDRGAVIAKAPEYEANVMRAMVQPRIGLTPYARIGNYPVVSLALVFGLFGAHVRRRRKTT